MEGDGFLKKAGDVLGQVYQGTILREVMCLAEQMPFWDYISRHYKELITDRSCDAVISGLLETFQNVESDYKEFCDMGKLWMVILACRKYLLELKFTAEADKLLDSLFTICYEHLQSSSLEKRVSVINQIQLFTEKAQSGDDPAFCSSFENWVTSLQIHLQILQNPHAEVLKRSFLFLKWLHLHRLLPENCLTDLLQSAIGAHESFSDLVYELIVQMAQSFQSPDFIELTEVIKNAAGSELDPPLLKFLRQFIERMSVDTKESISFASQVCKILQTHIYSEDVKPDVQYAAAQTYVGILRLKQFQDKAKPFLEEMINWFFTEGRTTSAQLLYQVIEGFKGNQIMVRNTLQMFQRQKNYGFGSGLMLLILKSIHDKKNEEVNWLLKCMDVVACITFEEDSHQCMISRDEGYNLFSRICASDGDAQLKEEILKFFLDCSRSSLWFSSEIADDLLRSLLEEYCLRFISDMSLSQYESIYQLFLHCNKGYVYAKSGTLYDVLADNLYGLNELVYISLRIQSPDISELATKRLIGLLTQMQLSNVKLVNAFVTSVFYNLATFDSSLVKERSLLMLKRVIEFEVKYRDMCWNEGELTECVGERIKELNMELSQYELEEVEGFFRQNLKSFASERNKRYFQFKFSKDSKSTSLLDLNVVCVPYHPADISFILDKDPYQKELINAFTSSTFRVYELALWIIRQLIPRSALKRDMEQLSHNYKAITDQTFDRRAISLLVLRDLSTNQSFRLRYTDKKSDLLELLTLLTNSSTNMRDIVLSMRHRFLFYFEVLLELIELHFVNQGETLSAKVLASAMTSLSTVSVYFSVPDTDKSYQTKLPEIMGRLMAASLRRETSVAEELVDQFNFQNFLDVALTRSESQEFSLSVAGMIMKLCEADSRLVHYYTQALLNLEQSALSRLSSSLHYFHLLADVLKQANLEEYPGLVDMKDRMVQLLMKTRGSLCETLWRLCSSFIPLMSEQEGSELTEEALNRIFFYLDSDPRHHADAKSRDASFRFLGKICIQSQSLREIVLKTLGQFHKDASWRKRDSSSWQLSMIPQTNCKFPGMKNEGATCYMNSIFQQLTAIESFTMGILTVEARNSSHLLPNFQLILSELMFKGTGVVSAESILYSFQDRPLDPMEQTDIEEFFNAFMHKIELDLSGSGRPELVQNYFKGKMLNTIRGKGMCTHEHSNSEVFLTLTLGITKKHHLSESLDALTKGEVLSGDDMITCPECDRKVSTESRHQIQRLPNILIIALRRFTYNIELGQRQKINDYYEFPKSLDMKKLTIDQELPDNYYQYELTGVVIHIGTADAGHYYSLINRGGNWFKFDDTLVQEFDMQNLPSEAFGGNQKTLTQFKAMHYDKSAYLLIYTRVKFFEYQADGEALIDLVPRYADFPFCESVESVQKAFQTESENVLKLRQLLSPEYAQFITSLITAPNVPQPTLIFALSFFLTVHCRKQHWTHDKELFNALYNMIEITPSISFWMSEVLSSEGVLDELLIYASPTAKKAVIILFRQILDKSAKSTLGHLLTRLVTKMDKLTNCASADLAQFFELMYYVVKQCKETAEDLQLCQRLVSKLIPDSPQLPAVSEKPAIFGKESYLGHPMPLYHTSDLTSKISMGFQMLILNTLFPTSPAQRTFFMENIAYIQDVFIYQTAFEQTQAAELLGDSTYDSSTAIQCLFQTFWDKRKNATEMKLKEMDLVYTLTLIVKRRHIRIFEAAMEILLERSGRNLRH